MLAGGSAAADSGTMPAAATQNWRGQSALHRCAGRGQTTAVRLLLSNAFKSHVNIDARLPARHALAPTGLSRAESAREKARAANARGDTALILAAANGHADCVRALLEAGADVTLSTAEGFTALYAAAANGHTETIGLLLDAGACAEGRGRVPSIALAEAAAEESEAAVVAATAAVVDSEGKAHTTVCVVHRLVLVLCTQRPRTVTRATLLLLTRGLPAQMLRPTMDQLHCGQRLVAGIMAASERY